MTSEFAGTATRLTDAVRYTRSDHDLTPATQRIRPACEHDNGRRRAPLTGSDHRIDRAPHTASPAVQHVRVDHRRAHIAVAQQLLDCANVVARLEQVRRERVARVWQLAGLATPETRSASLNARCITDSCK